MKPRATVIDYGLGNLHSVIKALVHVGAEVDVAQDGARLADAERVVLPGVGAFSDGMSGLASRGHVEALRSFAASGRPLIGICLGMQLLFEESDEFGRHAGLGIIKGRVERIPEQGVKVPHVGWNRLQPPEGRDWSGSLLAGTPIGTWTYFVHSYHARPASPDEVLAVAIHGGHRITASVRARNVTGFQYHPEKSGQAGLEMLAAFIRSTM